MGTAALCLVERMKAQDAAAIQATAELYLPVLYRWLRNWGVPANDVPAMLQRVFKALPNTVQGFDPNQKEQTFRGWLWTQLRFIASDHPAVKGADIPKYYPNDVSGDAVYEDTGRLIRAAFRKLTAGLAPKQQSVVQHLIERSEAPIVVATKLPFSLPAIRELKHSLLRRMRAEYGTVIGLI